MFLLTPFLTSVTFTGFLGNIGGFMGLFLGVSAMTIMEAVHFLIGLLLIWVLPEPKTKNGKGRGGDDVPDKVKHALDAASQMKSQTGLNHYTSETSNPMHEEQKAR